MDREVRYVTTADGVRIAYSVEGEGLPFVFIPGWVSHLEIDATMFNLPGLEHIRDGIMSVTLDKRGTGLSARNLDNYSVEYRLKDVVAVVDQLELERFALGGLSEGGPIAITFAATYPERVSRLIILGSFANGACLTGSPEVQSAVRAVVKAEWGLGSKLLSELFVGKDAVLSAEAFAAYQLACANAVDALKIFDAATSIDVRPLLSEIQCPTLVVHNRDDRVIPMEHAQDLAAGIKGARFVSFPGGHIPPVDAILDSQKVVYEFVRGGQTSSRPDPSSDSTFRTVLFTDIVGHTGMMRRLGDEKGRAVLRDHERITREVLRANGGSEVKTMGDGFMASFTSITKGVECAIALQRAFDERNASASEPVTIRVGLNAGEPIQEDGDLFGETVILAARIAAKAEGAEILVANTVRELCSGKGFLFADRGEFVAKGFEEPVRVYEVRWRD